jgi:hypothetical protein
MLLGVVVDIVGNNATMITDVSAPLLFLVEVALRFTKGSLRI